MANLQTTNDIAQSVKPQKYTKNDQLQKIYMKKSKPMIYQKLKSNSSQIKEQPEVIKESIAESRKINNKSQLECEKTRGYESNEKNTVKSKN